ncbi:ABC transporter permease [Dyella sp. 20L07]|uniref:ABC transporter permease n=1 Tax=Dyella sp. 20L07 TaxID=3384240 RepID=UPI003D2A25DA
MDIRPVFASLRKHRIPALLIVMEIALACAVLCNAVFMISQRVTDIRAPNAIDEKGLSVVTLRGSDPERVSSEIPRNLAALRGIAGVKSVSVTSTLPLTRSNWGWSFGLDPDARLTDAAATNISLYFLAENGPEALGLHLLQGRFFNGDEYANSKLDGAAIPSTHVAVVNKSLAEQFWPGQSALGKTFYSQPFAYTVVGVVEDVLRPHVRQSLRYAVAFLPLAPDDNLNYYVLRSAPEDRDRIVREAEKKLSDLDLGAIAKGVTFSDIRRDYFSDRSSMAWLLVLVCVVMLAVTAMGIVGLTSFWVGQRRRQIGIRRAIGASKRHIRHYFQVENFLLTTLGVVIGMGLAFFVNVYLMRHYEMRLMPWYYLPTGAIALWLLGQAAALGPAMRAAAVPPVVATRSV